MSLLARTVKAATTEEFRAILNYKKCKYKSFNRCPIEI
jgi:hypothetical protein